MSAPLAPTLVEIEDLSIVFVGGVRAVDHVSLAIATGETVGLVGESGSGKTTLAKSVLGLYRPSAGTVQVGGRDVGQLHGAELLAFRRAAQMIFQDPLSSLSPRFTIRRLLAEPIRIHGLAMAEHWPKVEALLKAMGIAEVLLDKYPHQLSGGQVRRVAIARALALHPSFIVADEPTAGLDVSIQGDLLNLLRDLQQRLGLTILMVSHNLNVVRRVTTRVAVMYLGTIVEEGPTRAIFGGPAHPYTAALLAANPTIDPERTRERIVLEGEIPSPKNPPPGCRFHTRCPRAEARCRSEVPALRPFPDGRRAACHFPLIAPA
jgi:peptide/nickel transport system ATP-binding protein